VKKILFLENNPLPLGNRGVGPKLPPRNRDHPRSDGAAGQKGMGVKAVPYKKVVQRHKVHIDPKLLKEFNELLGIKKRP